MKILFVEDNNDFAEALMMTLPKSQFEVTAVDTVSAAIKLFENNEYDVVITDIHLKPTAEATHNSGMDLIYFIRKRKKSRVPIVVTTGLELIEEESILESGADIFFHKEKLQEEDFSAILEYLTAFKNIDYKAIFRSIPGLYLILSPQLNIIEVSKSYLKATMTRRQEIMGRNIFIIFPDNPDDVTATGVNNLRESLNRVLSKLSSDTMAVQKYDIQRPESEGGGFEERYWSPINSPVLDESGNIQYIIHRVEDVTTYVQSKVHSEEQSKTASKLKEKIQQMEMDVFERAQELQVTNNRLRKSNQELDKTTMQLKTVNAELEAFSYSVSHDLRSPLRAIHGFTQALYDDYRQQVDEVGVQYIERILSGAQRMRNLIDDLIRLADFTQFELQYSMVNLSAVFEETLHELASQEPLRKYKSIVAPDLQAKCDLGLIKIVFANLLSNSWKFSKYREEMIVEFGTTRRFDEMVYFIKDNGSGFDMKYANNLFGAFQRFHPYKDFPGNGIGLATVRRVISRHGGKVWAESEVDKGTTIFFTL